ncbi:MAG: hypothetical protein AB8U25_02905 [Rickettsiales endosymbiont of Dermacentor nuttalli]
MIEEKNLPDLITELKTIFSTTSNLALSHDLISKLNQHIDLILNIISILDAKEISLYTKSFKDFLINYTSILEKYKLNIYTELLELDSSIIAHNAYNNVINYNIE